MSTTTTTTATTTATTTTTTTLRRGLVWLVLMAMPSLACSSGGGGSDGGGGMGGGPASCPHPLVFCAEPAPECPPGSYPEAASCPNGTCRNRCWTGACARCGTQCARNEDCVLVGRHGCCGPALDCDRGCFFAVPVSAMQDSCYFPAVCPVPPAPPGCAMSCMPDPLCLDCPPCAPQATRCEGGFCVSAWTACEPICVCR